MVAVRGSSPQPKSERGIMADGIPRITGIIAAVSGYVYYHAHHLYGWNTYEVKL